MWHKPCRTFHPWCPCIKTRCLSVIWDKFAYRRLAANISGIIVQKREQIRVCRFGARCTMPPCFSVVNLREIGGRKKHEQAKTSRSERPRRRHLDDGGFVRLPPVYRIDQIFSIKVVTEAQVNLWHFTGVFLKFIYCFTNLIPIPNSQGPPLLTRMNFSPSMDNKLRRL